MNTTDQTKKSKRDRFWVFVNEKICELPQILTNSSGDMPHSFLDTDNLSDRQELDNFYETVFESTESLAVNESISGLSIIWSGIWNRRSSSDSSSESSVSRRESLSSGTTLTSVSEENTFDKSEFPKHNVSTKCGRLVLPESRFDTKSGDSINQSEYVETKWPVKKRSEPAEPQFGSLSLVIDRICSQGMIIKRSQVDFHNFLLDDVEPRRSRIVHFKGDKTKTSSVTNKMTSFPKSILKHREYSVPPIEDLWFFHDPLEEPNYVIESMIAQYDQRKRHSSNERKNKKLTKIVQYVISEQVIESRFRLLDYFNRQSEIGQIFSSALGMLQGVECEPKDYIASSLVDITRVMEDGHRLLGQFSHGYRNIIRTTNDNFSFAENNRIKILEIYLDLVDCGGSFDIGPYHREYGEYKRLHLGADQEMKTGMKQLFGLETQLRNAIETAKREICQMTKKSDL